VPPLKLYLRELDPSRTDYFRRPDGTPDSLPALRLVAFANFMRALLPSVGAGKYGITEAVVDTGAHFGIVAEDLWRHFRPGFITTLPFDARTPPALRTLTIGGGTFPYTLGRLTFDLQDFALTTLTVTLVAKLAQDGGRLATPLALGLRGGLLDGRKLRADPDPTAAFGRGWSVEDP
jgi:hypothetical protein